MKWAAVSLVALSALCVPTALQAQDFTAASVATALSGFSNTFRLSTCFVGREFKPFQIAVAQMDPTTTKFSDYEQDAISEWVEEALSADPFLVVAAQRRRWELDEISKALGDSKSPAAKDPLDAIITIKEGSGRSVNVTAYAWNNGTRCLVSPKTIAVGKIVEAPDVPEKFFERAAKKLPDKTIEQLVVMRPDVTGVGAGIPARVLGQQLQEQLADAIKQVFQTRARLRPSDSVGPVVLTYVDGMDVSQTWQARLQAKRSPKGGIEVRVDFRGPPGSPSGPLTDRGYLAAEIVPAPADPVVLDFIEAACSNVSQALATQTDPDALQAMGRESLCPRLGKELAEKEKFHRERICSEDRVHWREVMTGSVEAMESTASTLRCPQVADDARKDLDNARKDLRQRKEREAAREAAIVDMKSAAVNLGVLLDGRTVERKATVGGAVAASVWKVQMTEADTLEAQFDDLNASVGLGLFDSSGKAVAYRAGQGGPKLREINTTELKPGDYYIRVAAVDGKQSSFTLRVAKGWIDTAGATTETARDLGSLGPPGPQTIRKRIGGFDRGDVYKFTAQERVRLHLAAAEMTSEVQLDLLNQNGQVIESRRGRDRQSVESILEAQSTYYVAVTPAGEITPYSLDIALARIAIAPHSQPEIARELTIAPSGCAAPSPLSGSLTANDPEYFAKFPLRDPASVSVDLTWQDRQAELELDLFKEEPGRRLGTLQKRSLAPNTVNQKVSDQLDPGTYVIRVKRHAGSSPETPFELRLCGTTPKPNNAAAPNPSNPTSSPNNAVAANTSGPAPRPANPTSNSSNVVATNTAGPTPKPVNPTSNPSKEAATTLLIGAEPFTYTLPANENELSRSFSVTERSKVTAVLSWNDRAVDLDMELKDESGKVIDASHGTITTETVEPVLERGTYTLHVYRSRPTSMAAVPIRLTLNGAAAQPARSSSSQRR